MFGPSVILVLTLQIIILTDCVRVTELSTEDFHFDGFACEDAESKFETNLADFERWAKIKPLLRKCRTNIRPSIEKIKNWSISFLDMIPGVADEEYLKVNIIWNQLLTLIEQLELHNEPKEIQKSFYNDLFQKFPPQFYLLEQTMMSKIGPDFYKNVQENLTDQQKHKTHILHHCFGIDLMDAQYIDEFYEEINVSLVNNIEIQPKFRVEITDAERNRVYELASHIPSNAVMLPYLLNVPERYIPRELWMEFAKSEISSRAFYFLHNRYEGPIVKDLILENLSDADFVPAVESMLIHANSPFCRTIYENEFRQQLRMLMSIASSDPLTKRNSNLILEYQFKRCVGHGFTRRITEAIPNIIPAEPHIRVPRSKHHELALQILDSYMTKIDSPSGRFVVETIPTAKPLETLLATGEDLLLVFKELSEYFSHKIEPLLIWMADKYSLLLDSVSNTPIFRTLVHSLSGRVELLNSICKTPSLRCKNILESSLKDALAEEDLKLALTKWTKYVGSLNQYVRVSGGLTCNINKLYECEQSVIKPNLIQFFNILNVGISDNAQSNKIYGAFSTWIPEEFLLNSRDPKILSVWYQDLFRKGLASKFEEVLKFAPHEVAEEDGFMYIAWHVIHSNIYSQEYVPSFWTGRGATASKNKISLLDLCGKERCSPLNVKKTVIQYQVATKGFETEINALKAANPELKAQFIARYPALKDVTMDPDGNAVRPSFADLFVHFLASQVYKDPGLSDQDLIHFRGYLKFIDQNFQFGNPSASSHNARVILTRMREIRP